VSSALTARRGDRVKKIARRSGGGMRRDGVWNRSARPPTQWSPCFLYLSFLVVVVCSDVHLSVFDPFVSKNSAELTSLYALSSLASSRHCTLPLVHPSFPTPSLHFASTQAKLDESLPIEAASSRLGPSCSRKIDTVAFLGRRGALRKA